MLPTKMPAATKSMASRFMSLAHCSLHAPFHTVWSNVIKTVTLWKYRVNPMKRFFVAAVGMSLPQ